MSGLIHTGLGSSSIIAHVVHSPPPPPANSFVIGPAVINTHVLGKILVEGYRLGPPPISLCYRFGWQTEIKPITFLSEKKHFFPKKNIFVPKKHIFFRKKTFFPIKNIFFRKNNIFFRKKNIFFRRPSLTVPFISYRFGSVISVPVPPKPISLCYRFGWQTVFSMCVWYLVLGSHVSR